MQNSRDSSVWRTLAVAFGDGLAFGVGVTLTRGAARLAGTKPAFPPATRQAEVERRPERPAGAVALPVATDVRFAGVSSRMERRLASLEEKVAIELDGLDAQDHALAEGVETRIDRLRREFADAMTEQRKATDADMRALRGQVTDVHREFAETLAHLVDEQIAKAVAAGLAEKDRDIAELRERVDNQERSVMNLVMAFGQSCLRAVEGISPAGAPAGETAAPAEEGADPAADPDVPGFARTRSRGPLWRVPIVSSFLFATGGLLLLHYL